MSSYLAFSYSVNLTEEEKIEVDSRVKKSRKDFGKGFRKGMKVSLSVYSIFLLVQSTTTPVDAADVPTVPTGTPEPGAIAPVARPGAGVPVVKPGMKPLNEKTKGMFVGGASAICGAFFQSGDFAIGIGCALLLVIGGIVINRPPKG
jgi:hypothetical protein